MLGATKKIDRLLTRGKEMMGQESKTQTNEDFRAMEQEMNLRHDGMDKLHRSMSNYVKAVQKRSETEDRDKQLPVGYLGTTMVSHGQDFDQDSEFGNCLISLGRANEAISRKQESYGVNATTTWLESLERSLAQMKEYQAARKKLEQRRVAYDTSLTKMQKQKREDFRVEEELRAQKAKYEEANEDVFRRMEDIRIAETESVQDLSAFLEAELAYYDSCAQILMQLKRDWPGGQSGRRLPTRSRSNTAHSFTTDRFRDIQEEEPPPPPRPIIGRVNSSASMSTRGYDRDRDRNDRDRDFYESSPSSTSRPALSRSVTQEPPRSPREATRDYGALGGREREVSTGGLPRLGRSVTSTEPSAILARTALRPVSRQHEDDRYHSTENAFSSRADSPSSGMPMVSRTTSWGSDSPSIASSGYGMGAGIGKKAPPPPPPSRANKPKPPPPPVKRSALGGGGGYNDGY